MSSSASAGGDGPGAERYRAFGLGTVPLADSRLAYDRRRGRAHLLSPTDARLLRASAWLGTLEEHGKAGLELLLPSLARGKSAAEVRALRRALVDSTEQTLRDFVDQGLLVPESELLAELGVSGTGEEVEPPPPIRTLGILTAQRYDCLKRAAVSYLDNLRDFKREARLVVADDSRDRGTARRNLELLRTLGKRSETEIRYADRERRRAYAKELSRRSGVDPEIVSFALLGEPGLGSTGAARNSLMLEAAGELAVQVDDDTVCRVARAPGSRGMALESRPAYHLSLFESLESAIETLEHEPRDFLGIHERLLGRTPPQCFANAESHGDRVSIEALDEPLFERLTHPSARVGVTFTGHVGDSGTDSLMQRLLDQGPSLSRAEPSTVHDLLLRTSYVLRAPRRSTLSASGPSIALSLGLDARHLLPPFTPALRNQDGLFGATLRHGFEPLLRGYVGRDALLHAPPQGREPPPRPLEQWSFGANSLLTYLLERERGGAPRTGEDGCVSLGHALGRSARLSPRAFRSWVQAIVLEVLSAKVAALERALRNESYAPWHEDMRRSIDAAKEAAVSDLATPLDLSGSPDERWETLRRLAARFSSLLLHWPTIFSAARDLNAEGHGLARPI